MDKKRQFSLIADETFFFPTCRINNVLVNHREFVHLFLCGLYLFAYFRGLKFKLVYEFGDGRRPRVWLLWRPQRRLSLNVIVFFFPPQPLASQQEERRQAAVQQTGRSVAAETAEGRRPESRQQPRDLLRARLPEGKKRRRDDVISVSGSGTISTVFCQCV